MRVRPTAPAVQCADASRILFGHWGSPLVDPPGPLFSELFPDADLIR